MINSLIKNYKTISIVGMSKNAGKTTVLNTILKKVQSQRVAITSIGLDGEKIDQVTFKPKPRIKVYKGMIVATAEDCLQDCEALYVTHEKTQINTALGNIVIIEILNEGNVLVAGPATKTKMKSLIYRLKKYTLDHVFIDGALFRKSFSVQEIVDAMILVSGASYNRDMDVTINDTKVLVDQLLLNRCEERPNVGLIDKKNNQYMVQKGFQKNTLLDMIIKNKIYVKYCRIHGAITNNIAQTIIDNRIQFMNAEIEIDDTISILCDAHHYELLKKIKIKFCVANRVPVLFLAINPYSPTGYEYDSLKFKNTLQRNTSLRCINVMTDLE